jgi:hypothetical protein
VRGEHFASDLRVAWLVCAYEAELVAAEDGNETEQQEKGSDSQENDKLPHRNLSWELLAKPEDGGMIFPCAGRGRLLTLVHLSVVYLYGARQG